MNDCNYLKDLYEVVTSLQNTSSRNAKEDILKDYKGSAVFRNVLTFLFDSRITTGLDIKKLNKDIKVEPEYSLPGLLSLLEYLKTNNTGKDVVVATVKECIRCLSDGDSNIETMLKEIVTKSLRLGIDAKTINKAFGYDFIFTFDVQLGTPIEKCNIDPKAEIFISQKLNGTRCVYFDGELWTRSGKKYTGCDHIINDIKRLCEEDFQCNPKGIVFDGELVLKSCGLSDSEAFQKGTGIANSNNVTKEELEYVIFDTLSADEFEGKKGISKYSFRKAVLESYPEIFNRLKLENIRIVPFFYQGFDHNKIWEYLKYAEDNDMEGVIVNLDAPYEFKRTKNLIKVKQFYDIDLECVEVLQGEKGKYKNTLGAIKCKYKDGYVKVGSGFSDELRDYYFNNPDEIIGKIITVKYKEITKNKDGSESLQFPVFVCVRQDKEVADA